MHVSSNVFYAESDEFMILLDLQTEAYYILDPVAASMWKALLRANNDSEAVGILHYRYVVEIDRLHNDLKQFKHKCITRGLLYEAKAEPSISNPGHIRTSKAKSLVLRAWWSLFCTTRKLSAFGFASTYKEYSCLPVPLENPGADELLKRSTAAFRIAENFFFLKSAPMDCLPRSLALFRFLRVVGLPVEHCIGVRRFPFAAHAWIEYRGFVVNDNPSRQSVFKVLARIAT